MARKRSATGGGKKSRTPKMVTVLAIVEYIIETYKPHDLKEQVVLMWREMINGYHLSLSSDHPIWGRDDGITHAHWKRFGPSVVKVLERDYKLTVVKVNSLIRDLAKHGGPADRTGRRTDKAYRKCIPVAGQFIRGIVLSAKGVQEDHPLTLESLDSRGRRLVTTSKNTINAIDAAVDYKVISDGEHKKIRGCVERGAREAFGDKYPLFSGLEAETA